MIAHSPRQFRGQLGVPNAANDTSVVMIGDDPTSLTYANLPPAAFETGLATISDTFLHHAAALAVEITNGGYHVSLESGAANTRDVNTRRVINLPLEWAAQCMALESSYVGFGTFHDVFLRGTSADPQYEAIRLWWMAMCSRGVDTANANAPIDDVTINTTVGGMTPRNHQALREWIQRHASSALASLDDLGSGFTQVTTAIGLVGTQVADAEAARAATLAANQHQDYSTRFGTSVSALVQAFTRTANDAALPDLHKQMATYKERSRDTNTINMAIYAMATNMANINETNIPKCTPYLLNLFRNHDLIGQSVNLGDALNPFSVICAGHPNTKDVLELADKMTTVESGGSAISMSDASMFKTKDGRFPHTYLQVTDKLWAYALVVCAYSGTGSDVAQAFQETVFGSGTLSCTRGQTGGPQGEESLVAR